MAKIKGFCRILKGMIFAFTVFFASHSAIAACTSSQITLPNNDCVASVFTITPMTGTASFSLDIQAGGTFYIDCGNGTVNEVNSNTTAPSSVICLYDSSNGFSTGTKSNTKIKLAGVATEYSSAYNVPAIKFNTPTAIKSIDGKLGNMFPTLSSGTQLQPRFYQTFKGASNITGLPYNLFNGITGTPTDYMFFETFYGCSGITSLSSLLFSNLNGTPAESMFQSTFYGCSGITSLPYNLFSTAGAPAVNMFNSTFQGCTRITSLPYNLFSTISGPAATGMFANTFSGCTNLESFSTAPSYVPSNFLANVTGSVSAGATNMFYNTGLDTVCPTGTLDSTPDAFTDAGVPWCEPQSYTITLDSQNATSSYHTTMIYTVFSKGVYKNSSHTQSMTTSSYSVTTPTKTGYNFMGYYDAQDGGTQMIGTNGYLTADGLSDGKTYTTDKTWYARWESTYSATTITLNSDRWAANANTTAASTASSTATPVTLYSKYNEGLYTDSGLTNKITTLTTLPEMAGYTFTGFYTTKATGGTQVIDAQGNILPAASVQTTAGSGTATWYARWAVNNYTIEYRLNGGTSGISSPTSRDYDSVLTVSNPTHPHGTFAGWTITNMDGDTHYYGDDNPPTNTTTGTSLNVNATANKTVKYFKNLRSTSGTVVFTAHWECNAGYTGMMCTASAITCNAGEYLNGATCTTCPAGKYCEGGSWTYDGETHGIDGDVDAGYYCTGGSASATPSGSNGCGMCPNNWTSETGSTSISDCYRSVNLNKNGGEGTIQGVSGVTSPAVITCYYGANCNFGSASGLSKVGYEFTGGWSSGENGNCDSTTTSFAVTSTDTEVNYKACRTPITYSITYNLNDVSSSVNPVHGQTHPNTYTIETPTITISNPTMSNYTFEGWNITGSPTAWGSGSSTSGGTDFTIGTGTYGDMILTADWEADSYTVNYSCGEGVSGDAPASTSATYESTFTPSATAGTCEKEGFSFIGWNDGEEDWAAGVGAVWQYTSDKTFTAQWGETVSGAITLNSDRWATNASNSVAETANTASVPTTVYSKYNDGIYTDSGLTDEITALETLPTMTGYRFTGFYTTKATDGVQVIDAQGNILPAASVQVTTSGVQTTWYARWVPITYTVTFKSGNTTLGTQTFTYNASDTLTPISVLTNIPVSSSNGWNFYGWATDTDYGTRVYTNAQMITNSLTSTDGANINLYGIWQRDVKFNYYDGSEATTKTTVNSSEKQQYYNIDGVSAGVTSVTSYPLVNQIEYGWNPLGWVLNDSGATSVTVSQTGSSTVSLSPGKDINPNYYALYSRPVTLTYNGNGETGGTTSNTSGTQYFNAGGYSATTLTLQLAANGYSKTGYTFNGWQAGSAGTSYTYPNTLWTSSDTVSTSARWTVNNYTLSYELNGGTSGISTPSSRDYDSVLTVSNPTHPHGTFAGWTITNMDGDTHYYGDDNPPTNTTTGTSLNVNATANKTVKYFKNLRSTSGTVYFTARWSCETGYTGATCTTSAITCNAGQYLGTNSPTCLDCPAGKYCEGGNWLYDGQIHGIDGDVDAGYYAVKGCKSATPTNNTDFITGGDCGVIAAGYYGSVGAITANGDGAVNAGYYSDGGATSATPTGTGNGCLTGYSCGKVNAGYYNNGGGTNAIGSVIDGKSGGIISAGRYGLEGATSAYGAGSISAGYYSNGGATSATPTGAGNGCLADNVCGACLNNWTSNSGATDISNCYRTVVLNKNGGTGTIQGTTEGASAVKTCYYGLPCEFGNASVLRQTGYTFKTGWASGVSGECDSSTTSFTITSDDTTINYMACKTPNTYNMSYNLDGGTHPVTAPTSATYNNQFTLNNPIRKGYSFTGWNISGMDNVIHTYDQLTTTEASLTGTSATTFMNLRSTTGFVNFTATWAICPENTYWNAGVCTACPTGTFSPAGSSRFAQCGHKLHIADDVVYLHSDKVTVPSLNIKLNNETWHANMTETPTNMSSNSIRKLKISHNNKVYYVCDDTICEQDP